jgi:hypothetical protein
MPVKVYACILPITGSIDYRPRSVSSCLLGRQRAPTLTFLGQRLRFWANTYVFGPTLTFSGKCGGVKTDVRPTIITRQNRTSAIRCAVAELRRIADGKSITWRTLWRFGRLWRWQSKGSLVARIVEASKLPLWFRAPPLVASSPPCKAPPRSIKNTGIRPPQGFQGAHHDDPNQYAHYGRILRLVAGD